MEENKLYHEIKQNLNKVDVFYINIRCENKEEMILKSKSLYDVIQTIKINYNMSPFSLLLYLDDYKKDDNINCKWKIYKSEYINKLKLEPNIYKEMI